MALSGIESRAFIVLGKEAIIPRKKGIAQMCVLNQIC